MKNVRKFNPINLAKIFLTPPYTEPSIELTLKLKRSGIIYVLSGINDWVGDSKYVLEDLGIKTELVKIIEPREPLENYRIGIFKLLTD